VAFFNVLLLLFPGDIVEAARAGLMMWFNNVLPALLPFIVGTNILAATGFVAYLGKLLDPLMLSLFRLPGAGGFALVTGMMSGYPVGAKTAAALVGNGQISPGQGWRLAALCNNAGPLFMLGAVGAGLFADAGVGYFIMFAHYASALVVGLVLARFAGGAARKDGGTLAQIVREARRPRPFGEVLGTSVKNALETVAVVGGYIVLFAVIVRILDILGLFEALSLLVRPLAGVDSALLFSGTAVGVVEMTNGAWRLSEGGVSAYSLAALTFVISFGGFSIHAQSVSFLAKCGVSSVKYMLGKLLHGVVSAVIAFAAFDILGPAPREAASVLFRHDAAVIRVLGYSSVLFAVSVTCLVLLALICRMLVKRRY